jgi:LEA14-like dessication related protein
MNCYISDGFRCPSGKTVLLLMAAAALAGCAGLPTGMEPPAVTIADFGVGSASLFEQQFNLKLRIQNPNPEDLRIDGIAFDLEFNGQPFAKGVGNQALTVPRFGSGFMPVEAVSSLGGLLRQFGQFVQGEKPGFRYRIKGSLSIAGGTRVPFDRRGEFDLGALAPK